MTDDNVCTNMETRPAPVELLVAVLQPGLENLPKIFTNVEKNIQIYIILSKKGKNSFFSCFNIFHLPHLSITQRLLSSITSLPLSWFYHFIAMAMATVENSGDDREMMVIL